MLKLDRGTIEEQREQFKFREFRDKCSALKSELLEVFIEEGEPNFSYNCGYIHGI